MIYLDASALVTFITQREPVAELERFLSARSTSTYTSTIGLVETVRTCDLVGAFPNLMAELQAEHDELPVTPAVRDAAARLPGRLRAMDAIHVATAARLGTELTALVTYDNRMADAARDAGLPVVMPGLG